MKLLLLDIETAPNVVHSWGLYDQNIAINQIIEPGYMLCWAAKWYGSKDVEFSSLNGRTAKKMLAPIHAMLCECDAVIHYNGRRFDIPHLRREFIKHGISPPPPFKQIDLLETAKRQFKFPSNKLDFVSRELGIGEKVKHSGHELWKRCMENDPEAWSEMEAYNRQDVILLEKLYNKFLPWIHNHPNLGTYLEAGIPVCPRCGIGDLQRRGYARTVVQKYARFQCKNCGAWSRSTDNEIPKEDGKNILRNAL